MGSLGGRRRQASDSSVATSRCGGVVWCAREGLSDDKADTPHLTTPQKTPFELLHQLGIQRCAYILKC